VQLVPSAGEGLSAISPQTVELLRDLNPAFAAGWCRGIALSVWPRDTLTALALYGSFAVLLVGTARLLSVTGSRGSSRR
jgi:hypothetical protein